MSGTVLERYEYDAYGNPTIWNADFTTERDNSNYGNPYLFTGRRVDILDSGSLKIQYNRNRYYDYYSGRWLTHDPLGIVPNAQRPNVFNLIGQYNDGMSLYEYVMSRPTVEFDSHGLWGSDTHYGRTIVWALEENKMLPWAAERVGYWTNYVDTWKNPFTTVRSILGWHFDTEGVTESDPFWDSTDSRFLHAEEEYLEAIDWCNDAKGQELETKRAYVGIAIEHLGKALHPVQDFVAHGTWKPWVTLRHLLPFHPFGKEGTDTWGMDFRYASDGILRDWDHLPGWPLWPFGDPKRLPPYFAEGTQRSELTEDRTLDYLDSFKEESNGTPCACMVYSVSGKY